MFDPLDYIIVFSLLALFGLLGYYYGPYKKRQSRETSNSFERQDSSSGGQIHVRTQNSFSNVGVPEKPFVSNVISLFMNYISATAVLGIPAVVFNYGIQYWAVILAFPVSIFVVNQVFVEVFYTQRCITPFEYLERRFGFRTRLMVFSVFMIQSLLIQSLALYTPAHAFSQLSVFDFYSSISILAVVVITYTSIGGIRAVVHIGEVQAGILVFSMVTLTIRGLVSVGGFAAVSEATHKYEKTLELFNFSPEVADNRLTFTSGIIRTIIHWIQIYGYHQATLSRYNDQRDLASARRVLYWQMALMPLFYTLLVACGLILFTYFSNCDPLTAGYIVRGEELLPYFVEQVQFVGLQGIFIVGVLSAALSSLAANLNSLAYNLVFDVINPLWSYQEGSIIVPPVIVDHTKEVAIPIGLVALTITALANNLVGVLKLRSIIYGVLGAPALGVFLLGLLNPWSESVGVAIAYCSGLAWGLFLASNHYVHQPPYYPILPQNNDSCPSSSSSNQSTSFTTTTISPMNFPTAAVELFNQSYPDQNASERQYIDTADQNRRKLVNPAYVAEWRTLPWLQRINSQYFGFSCLLITILVGFLISTFLRPKSSVDNRLLAPFVRSLRERFFGGGGGPRPQSQVANA